MDDYKRGGHSKYSVKVHLIFVTKYRKEIFKLNELANDVKQFFYDVVEIYDYKIIQMEIDNDHIHILLEYNPKVSISNIVRQLKQYSIYQMWNYHGEYLSKQYWKRRILWSDGYFACSIGQVSQEIIEKYIQSQGQLQATPCIHTPKGVWFYGCYFINCEIRKGVAFAALFLSHFHQI